jgi:hypothetical protein
MLIPIAHDSALLTMRSRHAILEFPSVSLPILDGCDATRLWGDGGNRNDRVDDLGPAMQPSPPVALDLVDATVSSKEHGKASMMRSYLV